jgi:hypothetical protein
MSKECIVSLLIQNLNRPESLIHDSWGKKEKYNKYRELG